MVVFRSQSITVAGDMLGRMFSPGTDFTITAWGTLALCAALFVIQQTQERWDLVERFESFPMPLRAAIIVVGVGALILLAPEGTEPFLYFQF
jgi:hypothetical protein